MRQVEKIRNNLRSEMRTGSRHSNLKY